MYLKKRILELILVFLKKSSVTFKAIHSFILMFFPPQNSIYFSPMFIYTFDIDQSFNRYWP